MFPIVVLIFVLQATVSTLSEHTVSDDSHNTGSHGPSKIFFNIRPISRIILFSKIKSIIVNLRNNDLIGY